MGPRILSVNAVHGFTPMAICYGTPVGVPADVPGQVPTVMNVENDILYTYTGGSWQPIRLSDTFPTITVTGNATIGGDLTVDSPTFYVDSASHRVGIGTLTPSSLLSLAAGTSGTLGVDITPAGWSIKHHLHVPYGGSNSVWANNVILTSAVAGNLDDIANSGSAIVLDTSGILRYLTCGAGGNPRTMKSVLHVDTFGKFGIGTAMPSSFLSIAAGTGGTLGLDIAPTGWSILHHLHVPFDGRSTAFANNVILTSNAAGNLDDIANAGSALILDVSGVLNYVTTSAGVNPRTMASRFYIDSTGNIGINTKVPLARLDLVGDIIFANNKTAAADKNAFLISHQYDSVAEPEGFAIFGTYAGSAVNRIDIGGGHSGINAATEITFHTAVNATTRTGTLALTINSSQVATFSGNVIVDNNKTLTVGGAASTGETLTTYGYYTRFRASNAESRHEFWSGAGGSDASYKVYNNAQVYKVYLRTAAPSEFPLGIVIASANLIVTTPTTPASAAAPGVTGTIAWDSSYFYICLGTGDWHRVAHSIW